MQKITKFKPADFENKWQELWEKFGVYQPDLKNAKRPFYNLMMFPYPSAEGLHVGNVYAFTGADIYGRFKRMRGFDVFEPIGLDGFGIHSENYAIKVGKHPVEQAKISEKNFYRQLHAIGNGFAWKNKLETYDPDYYRWTQWIFVQMFKHGLAYRKKSPVNFCPSCKTVLSDEQVIDGACERCKTAVVKKEMEQWFFKITKYAEKLLQNTYKKDFFWTEKIKVGQRNWIGKKEGINITYPVVVGDTNGEQKSRKDTSEVARRVYPVRNSSDGGGISKAIGYITCFTTRPDTNFGATFVVIGPEHPFVASLLRVNPSSLLKLPKSLKQLILDYVEKSKKKSEAERIAEGREKTGVFTGFYAVNQLTNYKMPVYISDFVLGHVGTGAVVGVPGHDKRDFQFAKKFNLPIIPVVTPSLSDLSNLSNFLPYEGEGFCVNSDFLNGLPTTQAIARMMDYLEEKGWGKRVTTYKLRDWCISRQRYWGAPIPMIYCRKCTDLGSGWLSLKLPKDTSSRSDQDSEVEESGSFMPGWFPVPEDQLPVLLPSDVKDWKPEGTGKGPLAKISSFVKVKCPNCGGCAERETDVCDTFLDSSWYFLRYPSVFNLSHLSNLSNLPWNPEITRHWLPVTQYTGGAEHTVLHLLYSRFVTMAFKDWGYIDFEEPFSHFYAHGLIIAEGAKMSKSRGNVIVPDEYIKAYGADTLRTYLMFLGPFDQGGDFRDTGIAGMYRFLNRVWRLVSGSLSPKSLKSPRSLKGNNDLERIMHRTIKEVTEDLENLRYNTAIAHIMEYVNQLTESAKDTSSRSDRDSEVEESVKTLLLLLAPFAPHMTEELWQVLRHLGGGRPGTSWWPGRLQKFSWKVAPQSNVAGTFDVPPQSNVAGTFDVPLDDSFQVDAASEKRGGGTSKTFASIHLAPWPSFDPKYLVEEEVTIIVQINGKVRDTLKVQNASSLVQSEVEKEAMKSPKVQKYLSPASPISPKSPLPPKKTIFVPGKLINFVI